MSAFTEGLRLRVTRTVLGLRYRAAPRLEHARLRWYREPTWMYRFTSRVVVPLGLYPLARVEVRGLEHVPCSGPVILAANHRDNLDGYLLMHVLPRPIHVAARPSGFGTGPLCGFWRRLGVYPADAWGMRYALSLLADGAVVTMFVQGTISQRLDTTGGAVGLLARRSGAPVIPVAITGTEQVHLRVPFGRRNPPVQVQFGEPITFTCGADAPDSHAVARAILARIAALADAGPCAAAAAPPA